MVYISIPKIYKEYDLLTSFNNWIPISLSNYDFQSDDYFFFFFDCKEIFFILLKNNFLLLDNHFINIFQNNIYNYVEDINQISDNNQIKIITTDSMQIFENNEIIFHSQLKNNLPNGLGKIYKNSLTSFEGFFKNGIKYKGKTYINNNLIYQGEFKNDIEHGQGIFYVKNKKYYEGDFLNGQFHGNGIKYFNGKKIYEGEFLNNNFHGYGTHFIKNRIFYQGEFENNHYHGFGTFFQDNGQSQSFELKNGLKYYNDAFSISKICFFFSSFTPPLSNKYPSKNPSQFTFHTSGFSNILSKLGFILHCFCIKLLYLANPSPLNA